MNTFSAQVMEAVKVLRAEYLPMFNSQVESAVTALVSDPPGPVDENEFIDASRLVYDGVREIRRAVLMNRLVLQIKFHQAPNIVVCTLCL